MKEKSLFDKYSSGKHWENHPTIYAESFVNFLKKVKFDDFIVDIGCGNGRDVNLFVNSGYNTLGIDYSKIELNNTKKTFSNCNFEVQNVEKLKLKDKSVGAFFMINVIHYVNPRKAIDEILRCLKPRGYLFIHFNIWVKDYSGNVDYSQDEKEINNLIKRFKIIKKKIFFRDDKLPFEHKHKIVEFILQKP